MSQYHRTNQSLRRSEKARARVVLPVPCARCGRMIEPGMRFQMGHSIDVAVGGQDSELRPEHWQCNQRAGGRLGGKAKAARDQARKRGERPAW